MSTSTNLCRRSTASNAEFAMHLHANGWEPEHRRAQYHSQSEQFFVYYRCISLSENWSRRNNLTLNRSKSQEIIFTDRRRKRSIQHPPLLPDIQRVSSIKILGVTVSDSLSVSHLVHKAFRPCEYFGHMAWQPALYTCLSTPSSLRNSPTLHHHGGALRRPRIVNDWKRSFVAASVLDFALLITCL